jgi:hypothetical protein
MNQLPVYGPSLQPPNGQGGSALEVPHTHSWIAGTLCRHQQSHVCYFSFYSCLGADLPFRNPVYVTRDEFPHHYVRYHNPEFGTSEVCNQNGR